MSRSTSSPGWEGARLTLTHEDLLSARHAQEYTAARTEWLRQLPAQRS